MSCLSFRRQCRRSQPAPLRLMPLLFDSCPPCSTMVVMRAASHIDRRECSRGVRRPSNKCPPAHIVGQILVIQSDDVLVASRHSASSTNFAPWTSVILPSLNLRNADLRALQINQHADGTACLARQLAHQINPCLLCSSACRASIWMSFGSGCAPP